MRLRHRLKAAWVAFCNARQVPMFAVIYDTKENDPDDDPMETYYEVFSTPDEAYEIFESAYPKRERDMGATEKGTERLVLILGPIDDYGYKYEGVYS